MAIGYGAGSLIVPKKVSLSASPPEKFPLTPFPVSEFVGTPARPECTHHNNRLRDIPRAQQDYIVIEAVKAIVYA
jgi:hypothetical protein